MSNIKITIEGVEKEYEPINYSQSKEKSALINGERYREVEPVKQDYEIMSFGIGIYVWSKNLSGNYETGGHAPIFNLNQMLEFIKGNSATIHSVKRLTDGEVLSVGAIHLHKGCITGFKIIDNSIQVLFDNGKREMYLSCVMMEFIEAPIKQPTILLTTEDGVSIIDPDFKLFYCDNFFNKAVITRQGRRDGTGHDRR